jgi:hypothetical protein
MNSVRRLSICFVGVLFCASRLSFAAEPSSADQRENPIHEGTPGAEQLAKVASSGRTFPIQVNKYTQLVSIKGSDKTLTYNFVAYPNIMATDETTRVVEQIRITAAEQNCKLDNFAKLLSDGYSVVFRYSVGYQRTPLRVELKSGDCQAP